MRTITTKRNDGRTAVLILDDSNRVAAEIFPAPRPKPSAADQATMRQAIANLQSIMARR